MNDLHQAAQAALEALEELVAQAPFARYVKITDNLRTALAFTTYSDALDKHREAFAKECDEGYACKGYTNGYAAGYENGYSEGKTAGFDLTLAPKITVIHAKDCWSWGPQHYECACKELAKAKGWAK